MKKAGDKVMRGEQIAYFQFGGSTSVVLAPHGTIVLDANLVATSSMGVETLVRQGESVARLETIERLMNVAETPVLEQKKGN